MALTLTPELAATIRGARLVGTPLRACVKAAGVPWQTAMDWLRKGRAYNAAVPTERNPRHAALGSFAADLDKAGAQCEAALHSRVMKETERDGRLALDVLRWNEERPTRELKRKLVAAQVDVETLRAAGLLVNRTDVTSNGTISPEALADPAVYAEQVTGLTVWSKQRELLTAARDHERVSGRSGHKVSKSTSAAELAYWFTSDPVNRPGARAIITAPTGRQVSEVIWREIHALHTRATKRGYRLPKPGRRPGTGVRWGDGREIIGFTIDDGHPEAIAGFSGEHLLFILDEASGIDDAVFEALDGNAAAGARFFLISNPTRTSGAFYDSQQPGSDYFSVHIDSRDSPNITGEATIPGLATQAWVDKMVKKYGADSLFVSVRVRGEFPTSAADEIFGADLVRLAMEREAEADGPLVAGLDVAAFGGDANYLAPGRGARGLPLVTIEPGDSPAVAGRALRQLRPLRTDEERRKGTLPRVNIDASGVGFGVWSLLAGEGFTWNDEEFLPHEECIAVAVNTGEAAEDSETYANLRAELHFTAKERLRDGASLPAHDELSEDLRAPKYSLDRYNRILVEPKLKIRSRLGRSPDAGDATLLRFYDPPVAPARQPASAGEVLPTENFTAF